MNRRTVRIAALTLAIAAALAAAGGALFAWSGLYDVSANVPHTQFVYSLLESAMHRSVRRHARQVHLPQTPLGDERVVARGAGCFRDHCIACHGAPGIAQAEIGRSMQPLPGSLADAAARWETKELYWIARNGIKMSGMPAWEYRLGDADLWAVVAFMQRLPKLGAAEYREATSAAAAPVCRARDEAASAAPVDIERGRIAVTQHACTACHRIPGITGSATFVGPPLDGVGARQLIAGKLAQSPENMQRWLRDPQAVDPHSTMPNLALSERDARDIAAFLATLR